MVIIVAVSIACLSLALSGLALAVAVANGRRKWFRPIIYNYEPSRAALRLPQDDPAWPGRN